MRDPSPTTESLPGVLWHAVTNVLKAIALAPWRALRWFGRGLYRRRRVVLAVAIVLVVLHLAATLITGWKLNREIAQLKAGGYLVPRSELIPSVPAGQPNAAPLYQKAFDARRISKEDEEQLMGLSFTQWTPQLTSRARRVVADNAEYYRLVAQAAHTPACAFPTNWDAGPTGVTFPEFARLREVARMLQLHLGVAVTEGRFDDALADIGAMLRIADHAQQSPTLIGALVGYAIQGIAVKSLREVLAAGTPSPQAARVLMTQLAAIDEMTPSVRAVKGEVVLFGMPVFDLARRGSPEYLQVFSGDGTGTPDWGTVLIIRLYATLGRPLLNLDELAYLRAMRTQIDAFALPWVKSHDQAESLERLRDTLPTYRALLTKMILPVFSRAMWSRDQKVASLGDAQLALALVLYKTQHGAYPDSLAMLEKAGFSIPTDPFSDRPYQYRREGAGFLVYSLGPDMKDDHGLPPTWDTTEQLSEKESQYRREHYDLPFRRPR